MITASRIATAQERASDKSRGHRRHFARPVAFDALLLEDGCDIASPPTPTRPSTARWKQVDAFQKATFRASWRIRGDEAVCIRPKNGEASEFTGALKLAWLMTLKASKRKSSRTLSTMGMFLISPKSQPKEPGARKALRPLLPNVPKAFCTKAAVLNQLCKRSTPAGRAD